MKQIKINQIFHYIRCLKYAKACYESDEAHLRVIAIAGNTAPFEVMSQRWRTVGNAVSDLIGLRFEPQASHFKDKRFTIQTDKLKN